jgi:2-octaprenyl-6-methoxyphenol hydroxylase
MERFTAAVIGGGPTGLATALALGRAGANVLLAAPPHRAEDGAVRRTAALFAGSIELLKNLAAWDAIRSAAAPISAIRIVDDTGRLLRAPEVVFSATDAGLDVFGWNVPNGALIAGLTQAIHRPGSGVTLATTEGVAEVRAGPDGVQFVTREGNAFEARLVAGADGRNSICRTAAGIATRAWAYPQSALTCSFAHERPHNDISTEFHRAAGPFTTVPLPGRASSLVWVERPDEAQRLSALDDTDFRAALEARLQGLLDPVGEMAPRAVFPLSGLTAARFGQNRVALVGEAGHVIPPIGAQGLNLGLRDAATLADCVASALGRGEDPGTPPVLEAYDARRRPDVTSRMATVDLLNRSLISDHVPVHLARGLGLIALKTLAPLRRRAVVEGLQPSTGLPDLLMPGGDTLIARRSSPSPPQSAA